MSHCLVSIILPVHNAEAYISQTIESIINQTYINWELIVIDDGSTDDSLDLIRSCSLNDKRIRIFKQENMGLAKTLNKGMLLATSEFIARIDADDICRKNRLELQIDEMSNNKNTVLVCSNVEYINAQGGTLGFSYSSTSKVKLKKQLEFGNVIFHPSVMFRKDIAMKVGGYDERLGKYFEDYILWINMLKFGDVCFLPNHLVKYRIHGNSISSNTPVEVKSYMNKYYKYGSLDDNDYEKIHNLGRHNNVEPSPKRTISLLGKFRLTSYMISVMRGILRI